MCQQPKGPGSRRKGRKLEDNVDDKDEAAAAAAAASPTIAVVAGPRGRRSASLKAAKKIRSLIQSPDSNLHSEDNDEEKAIGGESESDDEFIADNVGEKSEDELLLSEEEEEEEEEEGPKKKGAGERRTRRQSERLSFSHGDVAEKFGPLVNGARYITKFGVVEVVADDRMPVRNDDKSSSRNQPKVDTTLSVRTFLKRQARFAERRDRVIDEIASGSRYRREELQQLYMASKCSNSKVGMPLLQEKVWSLYCKSLTLKQLLTDGLSWSCSNESLSEKGKKIERFLDDDPRYPVNLYPDRIVECKLVEDERDYIVVSSNCGSNPMAHENETAIDFEYDVREKPKNANGTIAPMRLYITCKELTREYDASKPCYVCSICGKCYCYREGIRYHLSNSLCTENNVVEIEERQRRVEAIENNAHSNIGCLETLLTRVHGTIAVVKHSGKSLSYLLSLDFSLTFELKQY